MDFRNPLRQNQQLTGHSKTLWTKTSHCIQATWNLVLCTLPSDPFPNKMQTFLWKEDFGPLNTSSVLSLSPGEMLVAHGLDLSVRSWCSTTCKASPAFFNSFPVLSRLQLSLIRIHLFLPLNFLSRCGFLSLRRMLLTWWLGRFNSMIHFWCLKISRKDIYFRCTCRLKPKTIRTKK